MQPVVSRSDWTLLTVLKKKKENYYPNTQDIITEAFKLTMCVKLQTQISSPEFKKEILEEDFILNPQPHQASEDSGHCDTAEPILAWLLFSGQTSKGPLLQVSIPGTHDVDLSYFFPDCLWKHLCHF